MAKESKGHAKIILGQSRRGEKKKGGLSGGGGDFLQRSVVRLKEPQRRFHSPLSLPWKDTQGAILSVDIITLFCI